MMKKKYDVAVEHKGEVLFRKKFFFLRSAEKWSCSIIHKILVVDTVATITSMETGEIMTQVNR